MKKSQLKKIIKEEISKLLKEEKVDYDFSERELVRVLKQLKRGASTEVDMIKAFIKALGRDITKDEMLEEDDVNQQEKGLGNFGAGTFDSSPKYSPPAKGIGFNQGVETPGNE